MDDIALSHNDWAIIATSTYCYSKSKKAKIDRTSNRVSYHTTYICYCTVQSHSPTPHLRQHVIVIATPFINEALSAMRTLLVDNYFRRQGK